MAAGGIYDHLGGGFARYSTDERWLVPHFEKMLYDQALLARVYLHAWQVTGEPRFRQVLDETIGYVLRDLRHPARRLLLRRGRRLRRASRASSTCGRSTRSGRVAGLPTPRPPSSGTGVTAGGNWEGTNILEPPGAGRPAPARRPSSGPGSALLAERETRDPAGPRRQGAHRVERPVPRHARRGGRRHRQRRLAAAAAVDQRRVPAAPSCAGPTAGGCALAGAGRRRRRGGRGQDPRLRRRPRRPGRRLRPPGRGHRRGPLARRGPHHGRRRCVDAVLGRRGRRRVHHRLRRRGAGDPTQGPDGQRRRRRRNSLAAVGLLRLGGPHRRRGRYATGPRPSCGCWASPPAGMPMAFGNLLLAVELLVARHHRGRRDRRPPRPASTRSGATGCPSPSSPGASATGSPLWEGRDETGAAGRAYVCRDYVCGMPATDVATLTAQLARLTLAARRSGWSSASPVGARSTSSDAPPDASERATSGRGGRRRRGGDGARRPSGRAVGRRGVAEGDGADRTASTGMANAAVDARPRGRTDRSRAPERPRRPRPAGATMARDAPVSTYQYGTGQALGSPVSLDRCGPCRARRSARRRPPGRPTGIDPAPARRAARATRNAGHGRSARQ